MIEPLTGDTSDLVMRLFFFWYENYFHDGMKYSLDRS